MHLIITEKNIAANRISGILAGKNKVTQGKDNGVRTYRFDDVIALGLRGHVVEIDFEPGYSNWRSETKTPRTLIDAGIIKNATEKKIVNLIKKLSKKADLVTIATDYDREGELIGKEVYEIVKNVNKDVQINRTRFSAITPSEILHAFANPSQIDFDLAAAGEARQVIDLIWGASLTRFISIAAKRGGSNILSVGRVQSPTLAMIVDREKEIEAFIPKPYWMLTIDTEKSGQAIEARYTKGRFLDYTPAQEAEQRTQEPLEVIEIKEGTKNDRAPTPFDTTGFIVAAGRLNLSAANAMRIAEDLYMNGQISYPRTDNTIYPASLDLKEILQKLLKSPFKREVQWVQAHQRTEPTRGKKSSTDHPPIHPTAAANKEQMDERHWKVYELVVRRFLATLSPDAKWKTIKCMLDASGESYTTTGSRLAEEGYRHVYTYGGAKDNILPELSVGEKLPINSVNLEEKATQPPPRYSQSKLIQEMEELGLGTKSTRHEVIGKLVSRRYIEDTPLKPTLVGMAVIESLESHAGLITKPEMTQTLESHMNEIKSSLLSRDGVVDESRKMLHQVFNELEANEVLIGEEIMERTDEERILGKCPVCGHNLRIMRTKGMSQFIGCSGYPECSFNLGLPSAQWGTAMRDERVCDIHGLNSIKLIRKGARPWDIGCPLCNHINSNLDALNMMPSMSGELIGRMHRNHIYSVYEIANAPIQEISVKLGKSEAEMNKLKQEAESVLRILRKRSELKKFVRKLIPPRRGRSHAKVLNAMFDAGINEIGDLAGSEIPSLIRMNLGEQEAEGLLSEARILHNTTLLKELGIPAISLKKYIAAEFVTPKDFSDIHPAYLSIKTGINVETVQKHVEKVCAGLGVAPPAKVSKKALESGRKELLAIPELGEAMLEKLYIAGIINSGSLKNSDPVKLSKQCGIPKNKLKKFISAA